MKNLDNYERNLFRVFSKRTIRIMRLSAFLIMLTICQLWATETYSQMTRLTLNLENTKISDALLIIEDESEFYFLYSPKLIDVEKTVTLSADNETIADILGELFGDDVKFVAYDRQILLTPATNGGIIENIQLKRVTGKVTDINGESLPGVSVVVKGTTKGTATGADGTFQLEIPSGSEILVVSFIGMTSREIVIGNQTSFNIVLEEGDLELDEVVVIGYGVQKKRDLTGAVSAISSDEISSLPVAGVQQALQGQASGVMITQNHGAPGAGIQVRIRGVGTIGDSDPLYVIDGVPTKDGLSNLNTTDIESISILKDAAAAAIYGTRSSNGVILITTKRGKAGVTDVEFNTQYGIQKISNKLDLLNADQYTDICDEALTNAGLPTVWNNPSVGNGTDWQDAIFQNATYQKYDLTVSKGDENTQFLLGAGYLGQEGTVKFSGLERYNIRFNIDSRISKKLHVGANLNLARTEEEMIDVEINGVVRSALFQPPTVDIYNADGSYAGPGANEGDAQNPLGMAERSDKTSQNNLAFGNIFAEYSILDNLKFRSSLGFNIYSTVIRDFDPTFSEGNANRTINSLTQTSNNYSDIIWENTVNYKPLISESVTLDLLAGNTVESSANEVMSGYREGFVGNMDFLQYLDGGSSNDKARGNLYEWSLASFYGRASLDVKGRYLMTANVRVDGSSRFGKSNRWGTFPSVSLGWRVSEEPFFNIPFIDELKPRVSWGSLGNQDIGLYAFSSNLAQVFYTMGTSQVPLVGYAPASDFNPDVKWETTTQTNLGLDLSAFGNRLTVTIDRYSKITSDMLLTLPQPSTSGFGSTGYENMGKISNKGWEFLVGWKDYAGDFSYGVTGNISTLRNEVISLGDNGEPITSTVFFDLATRTEVGHSIREFYGYVADGIFQTEAEVEAHATQPGAVPGDIRFKDITKDGEITSDDRTFIGSPYPDFFYGINLNLGYRNFDFSALFQGQYGNEIYNAAAYWLTNSGYNYNKSTQILNRWTGAGTSNSEPRVTTIDNNQNARASTRYVEDGSYFRLKDLQIGYKISDELLKKVNISRLRIYVAAHNLLTITDYTGYDPEVGASRAAEKTVGFDEVTYPQSKSFLVGLNVTF